MDIEIHKRFFHLGSKEDCPERIGTIKDGSPVLFFCGKLTFILVCGISDLITSVDKIFLVVALLNENIVYGRL